MHFNNKCITNLHTVLSKIEISNTEKNIALSCVYFTLLFKINVKYETKRKKDILLFQCLNQCKYIHLCAKWV